MQRHAFLFVTTGALFLTGLVLARAGWSVISPSPSEPPAHVKAQIQISLREALASEAAGRWRRCQPVHWRACLLQR
jgi:hypothetical protein